MTTVPESGVMLGILISPGSADEREFCHCRRSEAIRSSVIPAKAGIQRVGFRRLPWPPACAGVTIMDIAALAEAPGRERDEKAPRRPCRSRIAAAGADGQHRGGIGGGSASRC